MKLKTIYLLLALMPIISSAQETFRGMVMAQGNTQVKGLEGATVSWQGTSVGVVTDEKGWFEIEYKPEYKPWCYPTAGHAAGALQGQCSDLSFIASGADHEWSGS